MKLETYNKLKSGATTNVKIKNAIDRLVTQYTNELAFKNYTREQIYDVVIEECITDCTTNSKDMLNITLNMSNIPYLRQLQKSNTIVEVPLFKTQ